MIQTQHELEASEPKEEKKAIKKPPRVSAPHV